jgi:glycosyltransferase involved in cell wall biosynthesis
MPAELVSVVIPVYNGANYLREAVESALQQTYRQVEVIVVDDGSSDKGATASVAEEFGDAIRYVRKTNGGVASALNEGIRRMHGNFLSWLSHDDMYLPDKIEKQIEFFLQHRGKFVVFSDEVAIDERGGFLWEKRNSLDSSRFVYSLLKERAIGGCSLLIPRSAFDECGLFDESLRTVQDYHLWYRFLAAGYRFVHVPHVGVKSRIHPRQDSHNKKDILKKEKDWLFSWASSVLPIGLITQGFADPAEPLFALSLSYKREGLQSSYRIFRRLAVANIGRHLFRNIFRCVRVLLWNRPCSRIRRYLVR